MELSDQRKEARQSVHVNLAEVRNPPVKVLQNVNLAGESPGEVRNLVNREAVKDLVNLANKN
jgi:hypothetical protein